MKKTNSFWGVLFIVAGIVVLLERYTSIEIPSIGQLWPLFLLIPGLIFEISYFSTRKNPGLLVPGGILTILGLLVLFEIMTNWGYTKYTWPVYLLAVAFGLLQLYIFDKRDSGLLIPIGILTIVAISSYTTFFWGWSVLHILKLKWIFPVVLIVSGLLIFAQNSRKG